MKDILNEEMEFDGRFFNIESSLFLPSISELELDAFLNKETESEVKWCASQNSSPAEHLPVPPDPEVFLPSSSDLPKLNLPLVKELHPTTAIEFSPTYESTPPFITEMNHPIDSEFRQSPMLELLPSLTELELLEDTYTHSKQDAIQAITITISKEDAIQAITDITNNMMEKQGSSIEDGSDSNLRDVASDVLLYQESGLFLKGSLWGFFVVTYQINAAHQFASHTKDDVKRQFSQFGEIKRVNKAEDPDGNRIITIWFTNEKSAMIALDNMRNIYHGLKLRKVTSLLRSSVDGKSVCSLSGAVCFSNHLEKPIDQISKEWKKFGDVEVLNFATSKRERNSSNMVNICFKNVAEMNAAMKHFIQKDDEYHNLDLGPMAIDLQLDDQNSESESISSTAHEIITKLIEEGRKAEEDFASMEIERKETSKCWREKRVDSFKKEWFKNNDGWVRSPVNNKENLKVTKVMHNKKKEACENNIPTAPPNTPSNIQEHISLATKNYIGLGSENKSKLGSLNENEELGNYVQSNLVPVPGINLSDLQEIELPVDEFEHSVPTLHQLELLGSLNLEKIEKATTELIQITKIIEDTSDTRKLVNELDAEKKKQPFPVASSSPRHGEEFPTKCQMSSQSPLPFPIDAPYCQNENEVPISSMAAQMSDEEKGLLSPETPIDNEKDESPQPSLDIPNFHVENEILLSLMKPEFVDDQQTVLLTTTYSDDEKQFLESLVANTCSGFGNMLLPSPMASSSPDDSIITMPPCLGQLSSFLDISGLETEVSSKLDLSSDDLLTSSMVNDGKVPSEIDESLAINNCFSFGSTISSVKYEDESPSIYLNPSDLNTANEGGSKSNRNFEDANQKVKAIYIQPDILGYYGLAISGFESPSDTQLDKMREDFEFFGELVSLTWKINGQQYEAIVKFDNFETALAAFEGLQEKYKSLHPFPPKDVGPDEKGRFTLTFQDKKAKRYPGTKEEFFKYGETNPLITKGEGKCLIRVSYTDKDGALSALKQNISNPEFPELQIDPESEILLSAIFDNSPNDNSNQNSQNTTASSIIEYNNQERTDQIQCLPEYETEPALFKQNVFDSHCHIDTLFSHLRFKGNWSSFKDKKSDVYNETWEGCITVLCDPKGWNKESSCKLLLEPDVWATVGCHPRHAANFTKDREKEMRKMLTGNDKVIAVGEIGLDAGHEKTVKKEDQEKVFRKCLKMAVEMDKPVCLHIRGRMEEARKIIKEVGMSKLHKIHLHCWGRSGTWELCQELLEEYPNMKVGLTPLVTFHSATNVHKVAIHLPLDRMLLETDAPYFYPRIPRLADKSGKRVTHPGMVVHTASQVASLKLVPVADVLLANRENVKAVYGI